MLTFTLLDEFATLTLGADLAKHCKAPCIIYLQGNLGSGKTTFVRGFLQGLGYQGTVKSPTYTLVEPYEIDNKQIFHFDLYRLNDSSELEYIGIDDYLSTSAISLIEWPEYGKNVLPTPDLTCNIQLIANGRCLQLAASSEQGHQIIHHLQHS